MKTIQRKTYRKLITYRSLLNIRNEIDDLNDNVNLPYKENIN